jgi:hypothetical protein
LFEARWEGKLVKLKICVTKPPTGGNRGSSSFLDGRDIDFTTSKSYMHGKIKKKLLNIIGLDSCVMRETF